MNKKNQRFFRSSIFSKSRKGQIFTVLAIVLIMLMFVSFEIYSQIRERDAIKVRVASMDTFLNSIEKNLERQMYIAGFRIIFLAESQIASSGNYVSVNNFFNEAFFNGTVNGKANQSILAGATYNDMITSINNKAKKINVNVSLVNSTISVSQDDPWNVKFTLTSNFSLTDKEGLASWQKVQVISAYIPVQGFEDPLFTVNTYAKISRKVNQTIYEGNYVNSADVSNLLDHVNKGFYAADSDAPSFLNRLQGSILADPNGIESFVNVPQLSQQGLPVQDKVVLDYIYFSNNYPSSHMVSGMPSWFKIDDSHKNKYQVGKLLV